MRKLLIRVRSTSELLPEKMMPNLFNNGDFRLSSGLISTLKIDCDALSEMDIESCAAMLSNLVCPFGKVEAIPKGGCRLAVAMEKYSTVGKVLICDDVYSTGSSMRLAR